MSYTSAVSDLIRQREQLGVADVPVNYLILGRALDAALPGKLSAKNGHFYIGSARMYGVADLYGTIAIPGVRFAQLTMIGDMSGVVEIDKFPSVFRRDFTIADIVDYIGPVNFSFLNALASIWRERIPKTSLQTAPAIKTAVALISIGIIVVPTTAEWLVANQPRLQTTLMEIQNATPERREAWYKIAEQVKESLISYNKKQVDVAAEQVKAAAANVAFWDGVYTVVETVRDAPAIAAGSILSAAGSVFMRGPILLLAGLAAGGAALWYFWPKIELKLKGARDAG